MRKWHVWTFLFVLLFMLVACQSENQPETKDAGNEDHPEQNKSDDIEGTSWDAVGDLGVVLSHGAVYDADSWKDQGETLAENGMPAFAVEDTSPEQLLAAADMLKTEYDVSEVAIIGASAGGADAIDAMADDTAAFAKAVLLSPGGNATGIEDKPVLVIYSEEEGFEDLESNKPNNLKTIALPGSDHAQEMFADKQKGDKVMDEIIDFLQSN
jgi:dienelactone hydrolase